MKWLCLILTIFLGSMAQARKPAVEAVVGMDSAEQLPTLNGETRTLYDFQQELEIYQKEHPVDNYYHLFLLLGILSLPLVSWLIIMKGYWKNKNEKFEENVMIMAKYKKDPLSEKKDDDFPKAS